jgi:glycine betaine/proline transport system ATP-binding protein
VVVDEEGLIQGIILRVHVLASLIEDNGEDSTEDTDSDIELTKE